MKLIHNLYYIYKLIQKKFRYSDLLLLIKIIIDYTILGNYNE